MSTWSPSFDLYEVLGSAQESYDDVNGIMNASVILRGHGLYSQRHEVVADICGNRRAWPKGAAGVVPKASSASIIGIETPDDTQPDVELIPYIDVDFTIQYTTKIVELASESIEPYAEFLTLDHRWFWWGPAIVGTGTGVAPDPLREEEAPGRLIKGISYVRTDIDVAGPLSAALTDKVGFVNSDTVTFSLLGFTAFPETLLYEPPQITYKIDSTNVIKYTVVKKFNYKPDTWNRYFRSKTGAWSYIYLAGTAIPFKSYTPTVFNGVLL